MDGGSGKTYGSGGGGRGRVSYRTARPSLAPKKTYEQRARSSNRAFEKGQNFKAAQHLYGGDSNGLTGRSARPAKSRPLPPLAHSSRAPNPSSPSGAGEDAALPARPSSGRSSTGSPIRNLPPLNPSPAGVALLLPPEPASNRPSSAASTVSSVGSNGSFPVQFDNIAGRNPYSRPSSPSSLSGAGEDAALPARPSSGRSSAGSPICNLPPRPLAPLLPPERASNRPSSAASTPSSVGSNGSFPVQFDNIAGRNPYSRPSSAASTASSLSSFDLPDFDRGAHVDIYRPPSPAGSSSSDSDGGSGSMFLGRRQPLAPLSPMPPPPTSAESVQATPGPPERTWPPIFASDEEVDAAFKSQKRSRFSKWLSPITDRHQQILDRDEMGKAFERRMLPNMAIHDDRRAKLATASTAVSVVGGAVATGSAFSPVPIIAPIAAGAAAAVKVGLESAAVYQAHQGSQAAARPIPYAQDTSSYQALANTRVSQRDEHMVNAGGAFLTGVGDAVAPGVASAVISRVTKKATDSAKEKVQRAKTAETQVRLRATGYPRQETPPSDVGIHLSFKG